MSNDYTEHSKALVKNGLEIFNLAKSPFGSGLHRVVYHQKKFYLHKLCATQPYIDISSGSVWINPNIIDLCLYKLCTI
jgi:hypothetical protein